MGTKILCEQCGEGLGEERKEKEGTIQVGQGIGKPLISLCSEDCYMKYNSTTRRKEIIKKQVEVIDREIETLKYIKDNLEDSP